MIATAVCDGVARWTCPLCGERVVARCRAFVERERARHAEPACPVDVWERAQRGEYDG